MHRSRPRARAPALRGTGSGRCVAGVGARHWESGAARPVRKCPMRQNDNTGDEYDRDESGRDEYDGEDAEVVAAESDDYTEGDVVDEGPSDVYLDVPVLNIDEIHLDVQDLRAHVSLQAEVLDLLKLNVGADVALGSVDLDIKGVEAQAQLKVRLHNVATIVNRVLTTVDRNPQILEQLSRGLGQAVEEVGTGAGDAVKEIGGGAGEAVEDVGHGAGEAVEDVGHGAGEAVEDVGHGAGEAVEDVGHGAGGAVQDIGEGAEDTVKTAGRSAGEAVEDIGGDVGDTVKDAGRDVGDVAGSAGRKAADDTAGAAEAATPDSSEATAPAHRRTRNPADGGSADGGPARRSAAATKDGRKPVRTSEARRGESGDRRRNTRRARTAARRDAHKR
ncbi:hypothetical protein [Streptomyces sp. NPDC059092]|uniref:hypothetical protein n=1 Tax=Streptomyces sp. NPDC059092 TaxID=3346725 RepID=UPI0036AE1E95